MVPGSRNPMWGEEFNFSVDELPVEVLVVLRHWSRCEGLMDFCFQWFPCGEFYYIYIVKSVFFFPLKIFVIECTKFVFCFLFFFSCLCFSVGHKRTSCLLLFFKAQITIFAVLLKSQYGTCYFLNLVMLVTVVAKKWLLFDISCLFYLQLWMSCVDWMCTYTQFF